jgi:hypothetical protein
MTRKQGSRRVRALKISSAIGAGAMVLGMITVGAAVAADSSTDVRTSVVDGKGPKKSREATPVVDGKGPKKSREATPVVDGKGPKKSREATPVVDGKGPKKSREARPVADAGGKKSREAAPRS